MNLLISKTISSISILILLTLVFLQANSLLPSCVSIEVLWPLFSSTLAIFALTTFGWCLQYRLTKICPSFGPAQLGIGQIVLIIILYLRSLLTAKSNNLADSVFNFYCFDITLICFGYILFEVKTLGTRQELFRSIKNNYVNFAIIIGAIYLILIRDLPQSVMLSTDPDQHLYFASRILFSGGIPWSQGHIGPNSFNYPAGFASLVAVWVRIGLFDIKSCLAVLPTIQSILAVFLCLEITRTTSYVSKNTNWRSLLILLFIFFSIFTFTNEYRFYHLQGTGRIGSWMILATVIYSSFKKDNFSLNIAIIGCVVLAFINPILPIVPGLLVAIRILLQIFKDFRLKTILWVTIAILVSISFIFIDPYYFKLLAQYTLRQTQSINAQPHSFSFNLSFPNFLPPLLGDWGLVILASLIVVTVLFSVINRNKDYFVIVFSMPLIICLAHFLSPLLLALTSLAPGGSLLMPYFNFTQYQMITIWIIILMGASLQLIQDNKIGFFALTSFLLFNYQNINNKRDQIGLINIKPRQEYCGCCPIITQDDKNLFQYMETQFKLYVEQNRPTDFQSIPKILIPNAPDFINGEKWIFPVGATRILPLYETFPLAFFYGQGSDEYSSEIYKKKVCRAIDRRWLAVRNIRYIVLPSKGKGCVRGLDLTENDIVYRSGNAKLVKLF